jgi:CheY-like chemotaxis protein
MNGIKTAEVLKDLTNSKNIISIPVYILTAYENIININLKELSNIKRILTKPLTKEITKKLLNEYL